MDRVDVYVQVSGSNLFFNDLKCSRYIGTIFADQFLRYQIWRSIYEEWSDC